MKRHPLPLLEHLAELRGRFFFILLTWLGLFLLLAFNAATLYTFVAAPALAQLPAGSSLVAVDVATPFIAPLKLAAYISLLLTMPVAFYQVWLFVAPGLYQREQMLAIPLVISTCGLFYLGVLFVYLVVMPLVLGFFYRIVPAEVMIMTDINSYLSFLLRLTLVFGIAFELPVAMYITVAKGLVTIAWFKQQRSYVLVGCFILAMLLTPPDVFSQILLAVPLYLLYEGGIVGVQWLLVYQAKQRAKQELTKE